MQEERHRKAQERAEAERKREEALQLDEVKTVKTKLPLAYVPAVMMQRNHKKPQEITRNHTLYNPCQLDVPL